MARREREILEHAVRTVAEQAAKADDLVDEAIAVGHGRSDPLVVHRIELVYALGRDWWGRGFATEAAAACLRHGFEVLNFTEIAALAFPENEPSIKVMHKLGFAFEDIVPRFAVELVRYRVAADSFWASSHARLGTTGR